MLSRLIPFDIWYRNVTDRRTDGQTDLLYQYRASVCWRAIKMKVIEIQDGRQSPYWKYILAINRQPIVQFQLNSRRGSKVWYRHRSRSRIICLRRVHDTSGRFRKLNVLDWTAAIYFENWQYIVQEMVIAKHNVLHNSKQFMERNFITSCIERTPSSTDRIVILFSKQIQKNCSPGNRMGYKPLSQKLSSVFGQESNGG